MTKTKVANAFRALIVLAIIGGFVYQVGRNAYDLWIHRDEPPYLVPQSYNPIWRTAGFVPYRVVCYSPARCEPNGKPDPQYFTALKVHEMEEWGLDTKQEIAIKGDPFK